MKELKENKSISLFLTYLVSFVCAFFAYNYQLAYTAPDAFSGEYGGLGLYVLIIMNILFLPILSFINYANTRLLHKLLNIRMLKLTFIHVSIIPTIVTSIPIIYLISLYLGFLPEILIK